MSNQPAPIMPLGTPCQGYSAPPPRRWRWFTRAIFTTLASVIFTVSLLLNVYLLLILGVGGAGQGQVLEEGDPQQKIVVVPINGMLLEDQASRLERRLDDLLKDNALKGIVLEIDSPGGSVTASDQMYHAVMRFKQKRPGVMVAASLGALAASGGYYVACAADHIVAQRTSMTGNIGVLLPRFNFSGLMEKWGVKETTLTSGGADFKNAGSMFQPEKPAETAYIQELIDQAFSQFKQVVQTARGGDLKRLKVNLQTVANGKIFLGPQAVQLGLADEVGYLETAIQWITEWSKLNNPHIVRLREPSSLQKLLSGHSSQASPWSGEAPLTRQDVERVISPSLMYLWRGQ